MKTEPKIGDYVGFKKPYVSGYPIGQIVKIEHWHVNLKDFNEVKPVYEVRTPDNIPCWRQATELKKSSYKEYVEKNMLARLEL